jgi:hypothetical protein
LSLLAGIGALLMVMGWLWPAHWKSLAPSVIEAAGRSTPTVGGLGLSAVAAEKPGPADLLLAVAQTLRDPQAEKLAAAFEDLCARKPELIAWGGEDRKMESILQRSTAHSKAISEPVMPLFVTEASRARLRQHLTDSGSPAAQAILQMRELTVTTRFVPAMRPGGQPFEATLLLLGALCEDDRLSPSLAQEIKALADKTHQDRLTDEWENACMALLTLGNRLNWTQLVELLRPVPDLKTIIDLARVAKDAPDQFPIVYAAALLTQRPEDVAKYVARFDPRGVDYLTQALGFGDGAVRLLLQRQQPVGPKAGVQLAFASSLALEWPGLALALKIMCFVLAIGSFYLVWNELSAVEGAEGLSALSPALRWRRAAVAALLALLLVASSEPFLFPGTRAPAQRMRLNLPALANSPVPKSQNPKPQSPPMNLDMSTILSVALFAALQVIVYATCLLKIREIEQQAGSPYLKLKLMENEENLFDSGLYVGIAGTAAALVLQVLQIIEANLLAAYSSNLFGILCVAFVKIRHVRAYKRKLILQCKLETAAPHLAAAAAV